MEIVSVQIFQNSDQLLHTSSHTLTEVAPTATTVEEKRAFMSHTVEGLRKLKEQSDIVLTELIES
jgi:hypothetical protein